MAAIYIPVYYYDGDTLLKTVQADDGGWDLYNVYDLYGDDPEGDTDFLGWSKTADGSDIVARSQNGLYDGTFYAVWAAPVIPDQSTIGGVFTAIADSVRKKTGGTAQIPARNLYSEINSIKTAAQVSKGCTATAEDIVEGKTAVTAGGVKVTGTRPDYTVEYSSYVSNTTASEQDFTIYTTNPKKSSCRVYGFGLNSDTGVVFAGNRCCRLIAGRYSITATMLKSATSSTYFTGSTNSTGGAYFARSANSITFYKTAAGAIEFSHSTSVGTSNSYSSMAFTFVIIDS